jgi:alanyl-tRNA synthetase
MTGHEIRDTFLNFFAARGHRVVRSSSLVPAGDPTLLFTNAGMNQFKDVFLGREKRDYARAATAQKCVRAGGKHNDLENVGYTRRHHTFFEMLGNFSFGDYFKAEAIEFAWDLVTKVYGLDKDRLYVTVFREDDDAETLWQKVAGVPKSRIFRLGEKDNFWQMGETGPCGPCSEIHYDFGPQAAEPGREHEEFPLDGGGRFVEIWNLVFMQFDRSAEGVLTPLPRPSIDTGMGLERLAALLQGKLSNYETDLIEPIRQRAGQLIGGKASATTLNIAADHARATAFLIHDGVLPSNEGRGYVLRKIMRRAIRHARRDGAQGYFLADLTRFVAEHMKPAYPELVESADRVARIAGDEEHRYATTFAVAEKIFHDEAKAASGGVLSGAAAFKLYDTYGLALDEQADMARELGLTIDQAGFEAAMESQRKRARASWKGAEKAQAPPVYQELLAKGQTVFVGYERLEADATVIAALDGEVVLDQTPFYAESGGQVGDRGALYSKETGEKLADVLTTYRPVPGLYAHKVRLHAPIEPGRIVAARVDAEARAAAMRNHTATHLLQAALQRVLGKHVKQAGSVVDPERLRFDFTHYAGLQPAERMEIENLINREILKNAPVITELMPLERALESGAVALFGEKYGDTVRVVTVDDSSNGRPFSRELCGGTHVRRTGEIGLVKITYEGSISAGVRRIEAVTGPAIGAFYEGLLREKQEALLQAEEQRKQLERRLEEAKAMAARAMLGGLESSGRQVKNIRVLSAYAPGLDRSQLRTLTDLIRNKYGSGVVALASGEAGAVSIVVGVTKDLTPQIHAGKLAGLIAAKLGGKGGGRPDMAEAGATDLENAGAVMQSVYTTVEGML